MRFRHLIPCTLYWLAAFFIVSCRNTASEKEEAFIKSAILKHITSFGINFIIDSLNKRTQLKATRLKQGEPGDKADIFCDSVMAIRYKNRNNPYKLSLDANLTYETFINFCQRNKLDPVRTARELR